MATIEIMSVSPSGDLARMSIGIEHVDRGDGWTRHYLLLSTLADTIKIWPADPKLMRDMGEQLISMAEREETRRKKQSKTKEDC